MKANFILPDIDLFEPAVLIKDGIQYKVKNITVSDYLYSLCLSRQLEEGKLTNEQFMDKLISLYIPELNVKNIQDQYKSGILRFVLEAAKSESRDVFIIDGNEYNFSGNAVKQGNTDTYVDMLFMVTSVVKFYGFAHQDTMDMPYKWFIIYLDYMKYHKERQKMSDIEAVRIGMADKENYTKCMKEVQNSARTPTEKIQGILETRQGNTEDAWNVFNSLGKKGQLVRK